MSFLFSEGEICYDDCTGKQRKMVFDSRVMKARLSGEVYHSLKRTIQNGTRLDLSVANAVADAMKDWAVENGATHFTIGSSP